MSTDLSNWIPRDQALAQLGISRRTLAREIQAGNLHPKLNGKGNVYDPDELASWKAANRPPSGVISPSVPRTPQRAPSPEPPVTQLAHITADMVVDRMASKLLEQIPAAVLIGAIESIGDRIGNAVASRFPAPMPDTMYVTYEEAVRITNLPRRLIVLMARGKKIRALQVNDNQPARILRSDLEKLADPARLAKWRQELGGAANELRKVLDQRKAGRK
jgi:hypothetical protein